MDAATHIDNLIKHFLDIGQTTADDAAFRERCLLHDQQAVDYVYHRYPWYWKQTSVSVSFNTSGEGDLPVDFGDFGQEGGVFHPTQRYALDWAPPALIRRWRLRVPAPSSRPRWYTLAGQDASTGVKGVLIHPRPQATLSLEVVYDLKSPTLVDDTSDSGLELIPDQFVNTVIWDLAVSRLMEDEGDARYPMVKIRAEQELAQMWASEKQARHVARRTPRFSAARFNRGYWGRKW